MEVLQYRTKREEGSKKIQVWIYFKDGRTYWAWYELVGKDRFSHNGFFRKRKILWLIPFWWPVSKERSKELFELWFTKGPLVRKKDKGKKAKVFSMKKPRSIKKGQR